MSKSIVDEKGRIVIPHSLREKLGLLPGTEVRLFLSGRYLLLRKVISPEEFNVLSSEIEQEVKKKNETPIDIEKLF